MDQKELREWEWKCIQEEPPGCRAGCPLNVDGRAFVQAVAKDDLAAARAVLEKNMPLAGIVGRLCEAPCEPYCLRSSLGGPIAIGMLERVCVTAAPGKSKILRLPPRPKKVVVAGGGPSSLTVAFDLAKKGYPVTLYHSGEGPGSWLRGLPEEKLPAEVLAEELQRLVALGVKFLPLSSLTAEIHEGADAVYLGRDDELPAALPECTAEPDNETFALPKNGWFAGGLNGEGHVYRLVTDVAEGREAAVSIDRFLQGASLTASRVAPRRGKTDLFTQTAGVEDVVRLAPADASGYSREEAVGEAGRCLDCQCLECVKHCRYLEAYGAYPRVYVRRVYNNSAIVKGNHQANTFINTCSLCRQCETLCPRDFSMADLCLETRELMVRENRMPLSAHWFGLEEMRSARSEGFLLRHAPESGSSEAIFFPGCQLAGIRPEQTLRLYEYLRTLLPATGIWLDCCGAPAHWAGRQEEYAGVVAEIRKGWEKMGRPKMILACSSCLKMFREHLPEIAVQSVWTILADQGPEAGVPRAPLALTDPCTSRHDESTKAAVRQLLTNIGQPLAEFPLTSTLTECCGFGGLMDSADPKMAKKVRETRVAQTEAEILTYCAMCRDQLARTGRPVSHILDLLFADTACPAAEVPQSISARRVQRRRLREKVLAGYPEAELPAREPWEKIGLIVSKELLAAMEERRILEDDVRRVLYLAGEQGYRFVHDESGDEIAAVRLGEVTFWVQYHEEQGKYRLVRCWSHRMTIGGMS